MISMAIALTIAAILSIASAKYALNKFNEDKGTLVGNQLQTLADALAAYIDKHNAALSASASRTGMTAVDLPALVPTVGKLIGEGFLSNGFNPIPSYGSSYAFNIQVTQKVPSVPATKCTNDCNIRGFVYLSEPIMASGSTTDIRLLGAAAEASAKRHIGYSLPQNPALITGPGGWTENNPVSPQRAGILLAVTSLVNDNNNLQYWLKPVATETDLPPSLNTTGDGRYATDTGKPYMWNGTKWAEAYSNPDTSSLSIGTLSGSTNATTTPAADTKNTFIGHQAGRFNKFGAYNLFMGPFSGAMNADPGSYNIFIGPYSGQNNIASPGYLANKNVFIGTYSGRSNKGSLNTFISPNTGANNTTGSNNIFLGESSGKSNTTGSFNTFMGTQSGLNNTGSFNTFLGYGAAQHQQSGFRNVIIGSTAGYIPPSSTPSMTSSGSDNVFLGHRTGSANILGIQNTFLGSESGNSNTDGKNNVFTGYQAGTGLKGSDNTAIGTYSGYAGTPAAEVSGITAIGKSAITKATNSISIGANAEVIAENSTAIGTGAKILVSSATNSMALGYGSSVGTINTVRIGNDSLEWVNIGKANLVTTGNMSAKNITATTVNSSSDKRLKDHITDTPRDLSFIRKLRPVDYTLISNGQPQTGFIAQEVESADPNFPGIVKPQNDRDFYALTYMAFIPAIVKSIQQLDARLEKLAPAGSASAPASVSGSVSDSSTAPACADLSLLKWLVLFLSVCVLSCLAVIVRFYKELRAMRLSVQRLHALAG